MIIIAVRVATRSAGRQLERRSTTNLLNPKVGVFFVSFLPGFIPRHHAIAGASLLLGTIFLVLTALYWIALLTLAGKVTAWMNRPAVRRRLNMLTGVVLVGFGLRLATES